MPKRKALDASPSDESPTKRVTRSGGALLVTQPTANANLESPTKKRGRPPGIPANAAIKRAPRVYGKRAARSPAPSSLKENNCSDNDGESEEDEDELNLAPENRRLPDAKPSTRRRTQRLILDSIVIETPKKLRRGVAVRRSRDGAECNTKVVSSAATVKSVASPAKQGVKSPHKLTSDRESEVNLFCSVAPKVVDAAISNDINSAEALDGNGSRAYLHRSLPPYLHAALSSQKLSALASLLDPPSLSDGESEGSAQTPNCVTFKQLLDLLTGTVDRGEGNSCLILGPSGSGKSRVFEKAVSVFRGKSVIIRLSGFVQHNDRLAMREIARQVVEQTGNEKFSKLPTDEDDNPFLDDTEGSDPLASQESQITHTLPPASHLPSLVSSLSSLPLPVIVLLDGFDLFTGHARQALLYCLLDAVQSCRAGADGQKGLAVIGLTSRVDVVNLLEKRVKSRFSHRIFRTAGMGSTGEWLHLLRRCLLAPLANPDNASSTEMSSSQEWRRQWELSVSHFLDDRTVRGIFNDIFGLSKDIRIVLRAMASAVTSLTPSSPFLNPLHLQAHFSSQRSLSRSEVLSKLNYPLISLLIAAEHVRVSGHDTFTFAQLHDIFHTQVRISSVAPVVLGGSSIGMVNVGKGVLMGAFEQLVRSKYFLPTMAPSAGLGKEFIKHRCTVEREDLRIAVERMGQTNLKKWFFKAQ